MEALALLRLLSAVSSLSLQKTVGEGLTLTLSLGLGSRVEVRELPRDWRLKE